MTEPTWWSRHTREVDETLASGDPVAIKRLYVNLGAFLEEDYGADVGAAPLLSLPETGPVVHRLLSSVRGLLLDAGCGPNPAVAIDLAGGPGNRVVALDIGLGTVRLAAARARAAGRPILGVVGDVENLPFRSGAFAGGVCDDTIEHLPDDERGALELARVVARGGRLVLATPNRRSLGVLVRKTGDVLRGRRRSASAYFAADSHLREYTWRELLDLVRPHFAVREKASVGWSGGRRHHLVTRAVSLPGLRRLSRMVVLAVEPRDQRGSTPS